VQRFVMDTRHVAQMAMLEKRHVREGRDSGQG
jgi:hypothetical protein